MVDLSAEGAPEFDQSVPRVGVVIVPHSAPDQELVNRLAQTVANVPGIIWKTWFINEDERLAGSLHLFYDAEALEQYSSGLALAGLEGDLTITDLTIRRFSTLNEIPLIAIRRWQGSRGQS